MRTGQDVPVERDAAARPPAPQDPEEAAAGQKGAMVRLAMFVLVIAGAALLAWRAGLFDLRDPARLAAAIRDVREQPAVGPLFVVAYAVIATLGLPATPLTLAGGAIFGTALGSLLNWLGATLGATGAYWLARRLGAGAFARLLARSERALRVVEQARGFLPLLRLRLVPLVPFNALNFAAGFARAPARPYMAATALGIIPGTIVYTFFADSLIAGAEGASGRAFARVAVAAALLLALSFLPNVIRRLRER